MPARLALRRPRSPAVTLPLLSRHFSLHPLDHLADTLGQHERR
jgi:hypothetical protein